VKPTQWAGMSIQVDMNQHVTLTFSCKDFVNFAKNSAPSDVMQLMMSNDVPLLCRVEGHQGTSERESYYVYGYVRRLWTFMSASCQYQCHVRSGIR